MLGFRLSAQRPPEEHERISDVVISRYEHVYEVDPRLMQEHVQQQQLPEWDFHRIIENRIEHLVWMQQHFADSVISGEELLDELEQESAGEAPRTMRASAEHTEDRQV
jgi:hypothetical protein